MTKGEKKAAMAISALAVLGAIGVGLYYATRPKAPQGPAKDVVEGGIEGGMHVENAVVENAALESVIPDAEKLQQQQQQPPPLPKPEVQLLQNLSQLV